MSLVAQHNTSSAQHKTFIKSSVVRDPRVSHPIKLTSIVDYGGDLLKSEVVTQRRIACEHSNGKFQETDATRAGGMASGTAGRRAR